MSKYYKIFPTSTFGSNVFDTIRIVAKECGCDSSFVKRYVGLGLGGDINEKLMNPPNNYFSVENIVMRRLNNFCRERNLHIRISRPIVRGQMKEVQNGRHNSNSNSFNENRQRTPRNKCKTRSFM